MSPKGIAASSANTAAIAKIGASMKSRASALGGMKSSLVKNLMPSAAVCRRPATRSSMPNTLMTARFGPMRCWIIALWRRSSHVSNPATFSTKPTMIRIFTTVQSSWLRVMIAWLD